MSVVAVFLDLDGTVIHPTRSFAPGVPTVLVEETSGGGTRVSVRAVRRVAALSARAVVVPATTRNHVQYERVANALSFTLSWAVVSNGARILTPHGEDERWRAERIEAAREWCSSAAGRDSPTDLAEALAREVAGDEVRIVAVDDAFIVAVAGDGGAAERVHARLSGTTAAAGAAVTRQGRKVYMIPTSITKEAACAEVRRRLGAEWAIAAGDGELDLGMLAAADEGIFVRGSDLAARGVPERSAVTTQVGPAGTDEMLSLVERSVRDRERDEREEG